MGDAGNILWRKVLAKGERVRISLKNIGASLFGIYIVFDENQQIRSLSIRQEFMIAHGHKEVIG